MEIRNLFQAFMFTMALSNLSQAATLNCDWGGEFVQIGVGGYLRELDCTNPDNGEEYKLGGFVLGGGVGISIDAMRLTCLNDNFIGEYGGIGASFCAAVGCQVGMIASSENACIAYGYSVGLRADISFRGFVIDPRYYNQTK